MGLVAGHCVTPSLSSLPQDKREAKSMAHTMQSIAKDHFKLGSFGFKKDHFPKKPMVSTHISEVQLNIELFKYTFGQHSQNKKTRREGIGLG